MDELGPFAPFLHKAQLANAVTGFATCFAGIMPLLYTLLTKPQPKRWIWVYVCILLTGIPTVWLHAYEGNRIASATDTGSNIFLVCAIQMGVAFDFLSGKLRRNLVAISTTLNFSAILFLYYEAIFLESKVKALSFGDFGYFNIGEVALIVSAWAVTIIFFVNIRKIPAPARPLLYLVFIMFFCGMILAGASSAHVTMRVFAWHAFWHLVGAFALITLWLFNHVRFNEVPPQSGQS